MPATFVETLVGPPLARRRSHRCIGLAIAMAGMLAVAPDAALLRCQQDAGGSTAVIFACRFTATGVLSIADCVVRRGGIWPLLAASARAWPTLLDVMCVTAATNSGFVLSLLYVDPAKALLLISINPLWGALLSSIRIGDRLPVRTRLMLLASLIAAAIICYPSIQMLLAGSGNWASARHFPKKHTHHTPQAAHPPPPPSHWWAGDVLPLSTGALTAVLHTQARCARESRSRSREIAQGKGGRSVAF